MHSLWATIKRFKQNQDKNDSVLKVFVILIYLIRYHTFNIDLLKKHKICK